MPEAIRTRHDFNKLNETPLVEQVIIPVFLKQGNKDVRNNHGIAELGKDIVGWYLGSMDETVNIVIVAKAGNVTGKVSEEVARQIGQAFNTSFVAGSDSIERTPDLVWVVTNGSIPELSRKTIRSMVGQIFQNQIRWMDGDRLWNLWTKHFPVTLDQIRSQLQDHAKEISDPAVTAREWVDEHGRGIEVRVKDASQLTDRHTQGKIHFRFPDTPEGQEARDRFLRHLKTGEPLELSGEYFTLQLPEILEQIVNDSQFVDPVGPPTLFVSPAESPHRFPVRIEVICDDGDSEELNYVEWRVLQSGTEETTLINDQQAIPIRFQMTFPTTTSDARYSVMHSGDPMSATWMEKWLHLQRCLSKPGILKITLINSGAVLTRGRHNMHQETQFTDVDYEFFRDLAAVEKVLGQTIVVPEEDWSDDDRNVLILLRNLLRHPEVDEVWTDGTIGLLPDDENTALSELLSGKEEKVSSTRPKSVILFGKELKLGDVEHKFESFRLADPDGASRQLSKSADPDQEIVVEARPGSSDVVHMRYLDWVDAEAAKPFREESAQP